MNATAATEAQRLYSISLTKIARSRTHRNGVSLHKNLLVATVLQRARFQIYMEDVHQMWQSSEKEVESEEEEITSSSIPSTEEYGEMPPSPSDLCTPAADDSAADKENQLPNSDVSEPTYLDLDSRVRETGSPTINVVLRERSNCDAQSLKRRHTAVSEWETEEAVLSILPKRAKCDGTADSDTSNNNNNHSSTSEADETSDEEDDPSTSMEIDRITSLVSIFSFGGLALDSGSGKLSRTVSTPDLCSAQAKESNDTLQQRPFIAMTV